MMLQQAVRGWTRGNGARGVTGREPLTLDRIRSSVPSVFAPGKHESRSTRYTYIPTSQIVEHLMGQGYGVFAAFQGGSRDEEKRGFTKHLVRFRPLAQPVQVGGTHNEIVLVNSHDGTSAYKLMAGVFRLVCSNGLMVAESTIADIRVKHSGDILGEVSEGVDAMARALPALGESIERFQSIDLHAEERQIFARAALTAKYGDTPPPLEPSAILTPRRADDRGSDLWRTLNVAQEALTQGGNRYTLETERGRQHRRTQPVHSVDGMTNVNRALWQLAEEMRRFKAG